MEIETLVKRDETTKIDSAQRKMHDEMIEGGEKKTTKRKGSMGNRMDIANFGIKFITKHNFFSYLNCSHSELQQKSSFAHNVLKVYLTYRYNIGRLSTPPESSNHHNQAMKLIFLP
ncbi:hypothetical protein L5515_019497 [Caenorhabditis briggsae]|uniref:Uncharacterized protein n=1 Tax=Caenorhabditis briggsae TaxID=6238 RepID=A0AAE9JVH9_CAEBR|nr:hypothetical protein L5515_019497 [Caenorhabditis briggsae]